MKIEYSSLTFLVIFVKCTTIITIGQSSVAQLDYYKHLKELAVLFGGATK